MPHGSVPQHGAAKHGNNAAADEAHHESPSRKLTEDEVKQCADRLSHPIVRNNEVLPPLVPRRVLSKEQLDQSVSKLYTQSIAKKKQLVEEINKKKHDEELKPKVIPTNELEGTFDRLYTQQMEQKRKNDQRLKEQQAAANKSRKLNKDEQLESAKRLCDATIEKAREAHRSLYEKYVTATEPKYKRMTKEELAASAARLCAKE